MRVHHLNCVSTCPLGGRLMDGHSGSPFQRGRLACHCQLVESDDGLVLVDTGLGLQDVRDPRSRLSGFFLSLLSPDFREEMTAVRQVEQLGFAAGDVRHIVLTHLDFDHAGGLDDFPEATVHLFEPERDAALARPTWLDRQRYRPQQWSSRSRWRVHQTGSGESWLGFQCVRDLAGLPPEILLVPLMGHTFGHCGVAIRQQGRWLLNAGDAYFCAGEMDPVAPRCTPGLHAYQRMMDKDRAQRLHNQERLRALAAREADSVEIFCAHDVSEFERLAGRGLDAPVAGVANLPPQR